MKDTLQHVSKLFVYLGRCPTYSAILGLLATVSATLFAFGYLVQSIGATNPTIVEKENKYTSAQVI